MTQISEEHFEQYTKDILYILSLFPTFPPIDHFNDTIYSYNIFLMFYNHSLTYEDLLKLAIAGFVFERVKIVNEKKILEIPYFIYLQVAQMLMKKFYNIGIENEEEYFTTIKNICSLVYKPKES